MDIDDYKDKVKDKKPTSKKGIKKRYILLGFLAFLFFIVFIIPGGDNTSNNDTGDKEAPKETTERPGTETQEVLTDESEENEYLTIYKTTAFLVEFTNSECQKKIDEAANIKKSVVEAMGWCLGALSGVKEDLDEIIADSRFQSLTTDQQVAAQDTLKAVNNLMEAHQEQLEVIIGAEMDWTEFYKTIGV